MKSKPTAKPKPKRDRGLEELILQIPVHVFVQMVIKSGLPPDDARELCRAFKKKK
jgi:hypothetical protein